MQPQESAAGFVSDHVYIYTLQQAIGTILSVSCILCSFLEEIRLLTLLEVTCSIRVLELDKQVRFIYECFIAGYNA